jgi:hypothetical protein
MRAKIVLPYALKVCERFYIVTSIMFDIPTEQQRLGRWSVARGSDDGGVSMHNVLHDIEMYAPKSASARGSIFDRIFDKGELSRSKVIVSQLIQSPQRDIKFLEGRQKALQGIPREVVETSLAKCKNLEENVVWVYENHGSDTTWLFSHRGTQDV